MTSPLKRLLLKLPSEDEVANSEDEVASSSTPTDEIEEPSPFKFESGSSEDDEPVAKKARSQKKPKQRPVKYNCTAKDRFTGKTSLVTKLLSCAKRPCATLHRILQRQLRSWPGLQSKQPFFQNVFVVRS